MKVSFGVAGRCGVQANEAASMSERISNLDQVRILQLPLNRVIKTSIISKNKGRKEMQRTILNADDLAEAVKELDGWEVKGTWLLKKMEFEDFAGALAFVNAVGELAEEADHHPDITFGWGYAEIALTTHDREAVTDVDIDLAKQIDQLTAEP
jgi:4a-hydroxytetrahydrobiopterin dehydratase